MMEKKGVQRSNFSVTCSLLSQYLKEKRRNGELGGKSVTTTTMSLLPGVDVSHENNKKNAEQNAELIATIITSAKDNTVNNSANKQSQKSQMTIFYGGKVLVFDNFSAEKAMDVMQMASKESQNFMLKNPPVCKDECNDLQQPANASDMPRRNSLHRFLEKRKDRISTKAPYQVHYNSSHAAKPKDSQAWLGLGPQASKPEHNSVVNSK